MFERLTKHLEERWEAHVKTYHGEAESAMADEFKRRMEAAGVRVPVSLIEFFSQVRTLRSLPQEIRESKTELGLLFEHSCRFENLQETSFRGEKIHIPKTILADGTERRAESGDKIELHLVRKQGVDPKYVLFFRVSQSSEQPNPEYYWTSDYKEVTQGLNREIAGEERVTSIILISTLELINQNGGLIRDVNDCDGISVRQISTDPFPKDSILGQFSSSETK